MVSRVFWGFFFESFFRCCVVFAVLGFGFSLLYFAFFSLFSFFSVSFVDCSFVIDLKVVGHCLAW